MENIILIGMPGSGKSTVGVLLAKALGYDFVDVDLVIQRREGALLQEILDARGVEAFLDAEEQAVLSLDCDRCVIAPGGSAVCRESAARRLKALGTVIYLQVPLEELSSRIQNLSTRAPLYDKYADLTVYCGGQTLAQTARQVRELLTLRSGGSPSPQGRYVGRAENSSALNQ